MCKEEKQILNINCATDLFFLATDLVTVYRFAPTLFGLAMVLQRKSVANYSGLVGTLGEILIKLNYRYLLQARIGRTHGDGIIFDYLDTMRTPEIIFCCGTIEEGATMTGAFTLKLEVCLRAPRTGIDKAEPVVAKYGDKSLYFDWEDLGNTTSEWDVYGSDPPSPYNSLKVQMILRVFSIAFSCQFLVFRRNVSKGVFVFCSEVDKSMYFDWEDLGNTTGEWDVYGLDPPSPYNSLKVQMILRVFGIVFSSEAGMVTEGERSDPCLTERDAHRFLYVVDLMLLKTGLSGGGTFMSGREETYFHHQAGQQFIGSIDLDDSDGHHTKKIKTSAPGAYDTSCDAQTCINLDDDDGVY
ncbi:photosystem I reaction center subunit VI, chloroplastic [Tanacetum coccineum]